MVDRRIDLDRTRDVVVRGQGLDRALRSRDDADRERALLSEWAPDRGDRLTDDDAARITEGHRCHGVVARIDLDDADVVEQVPADDLAGNTVAVGEDDVDAGGAVDRGAVSGARALAGVRDHVRVREHVPFVRDDEARALRALAAAEERVDGDDATRAAGVDLRRIEAVSEQRRRRPDRAGLGRRRLDDDSARAFVLPDPPGQGADKQDGDCTQCCCHQCDDSKGSGSHRHRVATVVFTWKRARLRVARPPTSAQRPARPARPSGRARIPARPRRP